MMKGHYTAASALLKLLPLERNEFKVFCVVLDVVVCKKITAVV